MATDPTKLVFDGLPVPSPGTVHLTFGDDSPEPPAHGVRLVFGQPAVASPGTVRLVFGGEDDGPAPGWRPHPGAGRGLSGVRERVTALGGTLAIDSRRPGFRVEARIPDRETP